MIVAAIAVASCAKETLKDESKTIVAPEIVASQENQPEAKTILNVNEGVGTIYWKPAENINVFYGTTNVLYTSKNKENVTVASFKTTEIIGATEEASTNIWGLYPYDEDATCNGSKVTTTIASTQYGVPETFDDNLFTTLAHSETRELRFFNVCGGIKFSLSRDDITKITFEGNNGETLAGKVDLTFVDDVPAATTVTAETMITLVPKTGSTFAKDVNYYIITLPVSMTGGFTMTFETATKIGTFNYTEKAIKISRSKFSKKEHIDTYATYTDSPAENISEIGTANCYLIDKAGRYKFKAVKGNSQVSVGDVKGVKVLWESYGTNVTPIVGSLILPNVTYNNGYIIFSTNDAYKCGNAVIAAYSDANCTDGNVLWSWHIWMTDKPEEQVYYHNAGTVMDRNLGAYSADMGDVRALGLLYQWGRKDPFLGSMYINSNEVAKSTISWPAFENASNHILDNNTLSYSISHPTTFLSNNNDPYDWYCISEQHLNDNLWSANKTIYDPCPAGWKIPSGGPDGLWATAFGTSKCIEDGPWEKRYFGMDYGTGNDGYLYTHIGNSHTIWYPATGYFDDGSLNCVGRLGNCWSSTPEEDGDVYYFELDGSVYDTCPATSESRVIAQSVRCVKDETFVPTVITDLSNNGSANCYIVSDAGKYKFKTVQGNTNTSVGDVKGVKVLWESFGTDVAPSVGDLIKPDVCYDDGYIIFSTNDTYREGNAVIAAYSDANCTDGNVLWSWHIWMTDQPEEQVYNNNAGILMDRNLGATSATPGEVQTLGLHFQWGRKDPFLGSGKINSTEVAKSTLLWPSMVSSDNSQGTIAYAISHPTTFIFYNSLNYDWYYTGSSTTDNTRWKLFAKEKGVYDPCPAGWRVMSSDAWSTAFGSSSIFYNGPWDSNNLGMNFGSGNGKGTSMQLGSTSTIWYPAAGHVYTSTMTLADVGSSGDYWACTPSYYYADYSSFHDSGGVNPYYSNGRFFGFSVRCQKNQ